MSPEPCIGNDGVPRVSVYANFRTTTRLIGLFAGSVSKPVAGFVYFVVIFSARLEKSVV